ncbi:MAG: hypothetical protein MK212_00200 [Saprospiraceae bacterium]|nr:hypothetical protein [Saprospiraceae bacterium]
MNNNYNIKENIPKLSSEQINKHQDFDALFAQFEQTTPTPEAEVTKVVELPKASPGKSLLVRYGLGAIMAVAASVLVIFMIKQIDISGDPTGIRSGVLTLHEPLPQIQQPFTNYSIDDVSNGYTIQHPTGSKITVPASAFVDKNGEIVKGKVDIQYREFEDHVDMFLAGVPKQQDKHQNLQSTGMMQIQGYQNGEAIYIGEGKKIAVELKAAIAQNLDIENPRVQLFNEKEDQWEDKGVDDLSLVPSKAASDNLGNQNTNNEGNTNGDIDDPAPDPALSEIELEKALAKIGKKYPMPDLPIEPKSYNDDKPTFGFDVDTQEFPEFKNHQDLLFQPRTMDKFNSKWSEIEWADYKITRKDDYFLIKLSIGDMVAEFDAVIVAQGQQLQRLREQYQKDLAEYQAKLQERQNQIDSDFAAFRASRTNLDQPIVNNDPPATDSTNNSTLNLVKVVMNRFDIDHFGLWNCGKTAELSETLNTNISLLGGIEATEQVAVSSVFIANEKEGLYYFKELKEAASEFAVKLDPSKEYVVWAMTEDRKVFVANMLKESDPNQEVYRFYMQPATGLETEQDVRKLLNKPEEVVM